MVRVPQFHNDVEAVIASLTNPTRRIISSNYALIAADVGMMLHITAPAGVTITLPSDSSETIDLESWNRWRVYSAGQATFVAGAGATVLNRISAFRSARQYASGRVIKVDVNTWLVEGDLVP
jgi:hypothetical protein